MCVYTCLRVYVSRERAEGGAGLGGELGALAGTQWHKGWGTSLAMCHGRASVSVGHSRVGPLTTLMSTHLRQADDGLLQRRLAVVVRAVLRNVARQLRHLRGGSGARGVTARCEGGGVCWNGCSGHPLHPFEWGRRLLEV